MHTIVTGKNDKVYYRSIIEMLTHEEGEVKVTRMTSHIFEDLESVKEYTFSFIHNIYMNIMNGLIKLPYPMDPRYIQFYKGDDVTSPHIYYGKSGIPEGLGIKILFRRNVQNIIICNAGSARYMKIGNFIISKKNNLYIITDHRGVVCETISTEGIEDIADLLDKVSDIIEPMDPDYVSGDDFNIPINFNRNKWELIVKLPIEVNGITIKPGTVLGVKDKFPGDNGDDVEKGYWQIKDSYGGTFSMSYEDRKKYFEGVI